MTNKAIDFNLSRIITQQFATFPENYTIGVPINVNTNIRFLSEMTQHLIGVVAGFKFEQKGIPFISVEVLMQFKISDQSWENLRDSGNPRTIQVHKNFLSHLASLTVGATRGVLHAKTEGTQFNQLILPTVNLNLLIKDELISFKEL